MKRLLVAFAALTGFSSHAATICDERVDFAELIAVAKAKKLDERAVTEASVTDPSADLPTRLWRIEMIQAVYHDFTGPMTREVAARAAREQCEAGVAKGKAR